MEYNHKTESSQTSVC